jgi:SAM-dependent methyltransferase
VKQSPPPASVFEIGCGNGATAHMLSMLGYEVSGIDASISGIKIANAAYPELRLEVGSAYDDLAERYGKFDVVLSLEVIEHLYAPRIFIRSLRNLLQPRGLGVVSAPYHGYLKNLVLAAANRFDRHLDPLWDGGHIKFWSRASISRLLQEFAFEDPEFIRIGRLPPLAKSLMVSFRAPSEDR